MSYLDAKCTDALNHITQCSCELDFGLKECMTKNAMGLREIMLETMRVIASLVQQGNNADAMKLQQSFAKVLEAASSFNESVGNL